MGEKAEKQPPEAHQRLSTHEETASYRTVLTTVAHASFSKERGKLFTTSYTVLANSTASAHYSALQACVCTCVVIAATECDP